MSPRTPGPWYVEHTAAFGLCVVHGERDSKTGDRDNLPFAQCIRHPTAEQRANAHLIAAAPALLAALLNVEWGGQEDLEEGGYGAACPSCGALKRDGGGHFSGCELRAALDEALGVQTPELVGSSEGGE